MRLSRSLLVFVALFVLCASAAERVLVVLENQTVEKNYSKYLQFLKDEGFEVTIRDAGDSELDFESYGAFNYDHLVLLAPHAESIEGNINPETIVSFIDAGHNVLIAGTHKSSGLIRQVISAVGIEADESGRYATDHFNFNSTDADHTLLVADRFVANKLLAGPSPAPVLYRGGALFLNPHSQLNFAILSGSPYSFSAARSQTSDFAVAGISTVLVAGTQARNNARVVVSGSMELFSDRLFRSPVQKYSKDGSAKVHEKSGNEEFVHAISRWALKQKGVLRVTDKRFEHVDKPEKGNIYTIKDRMRFSATIEEWDGKQWQPLRSEHVQLEFIMLDPYLRLNLQHDNKGHFFSEFTLPDVYGIFTLKLNFRQLGYTIIEESSVHTVRPFRHDEYERFIVAAYPYYTGTFSMIVGAVLFSILFLWQK